MHTYRTDGKGTWTVGHYVFLNGTSEWWPLSDHQSEKLAIARVHYLNGGAADALDSIERAIYSTVPA